MGKIYDALKKASNEREVATPSRKTFYTKNNLEKINKKDIFDNRIYSLLENKNIDKNLITLLNPDSIESEQIKMLRSNILFPASEDTRHSIMIASAMPNEGKSFIAVNLAISIAQSNKHVLLVDSDARRPSIHSMLGIGDIPGLCDYLEKPVSLAPFLFKTNIDKLTVLPAGKTTHTPSELISSKKMSDLIHEVKERYADRYVIIDSPPMQLAAETKAIASAVDGIIIVVKSGGTKREFIEDLINTFGKKKIIGVVLNHFNKKLSAYKNYAYYK